MENNYRHEYKFMLTPQAAALLKLRLPHFMQRDPQAGPDGIYTIRSLYFDDREYTAFHEKLSGVDNRTKYRIRYYNYDPTFIRLECKEKKGSLTRKQGQTISRADALALMQASPEGCPDHPRGLTETLTRLCGSGMTPEVLVDYDRTPFICHSGNTRITLDENVRTIPYCGDLFETSRSMVPVLEPDQVILEVKFDDFLPGYLSDVLRDIPKAPMSISKFALCMNLI